MSWHPVQNSYWKIDVKVIQVVIQAGKTFGSDDSKSNNSTRRLERYLLFICFIVVKIFLRMAHSRGFEPLTSVFEGQRSIQQYIENA